MVGTRGKTKQVLDYLKSGHSITCREAFDMFGLIRLSAVIFELRKAGYDIRSQTINKTENDVKYYLIIKD